MQTGSLGMHDLPALGFRLAGQQVAMMDVGEFDAMVVMNVPDPRFADRVVADRAAVLFTEDSEGSIQPVVMPGLVRVKQLEAYWPEEDQEILVADVTSANPSWQAYPSVLGVPVMPWSVTWGSPEYEDSVVPTPYRVWDAWPLDGYQVLELEAAIADAWERSGYEDARTYWALHDGLEAGGYDAYGTISLELNALQEALFPSWVSADGRAAGLYHPDALAPIVDFVMDDELDELWRELREVSQRNWMTARRTVRPDRRATWDWQERRLNPWYCS